MQVKVIERFASLKHIIRANRDWPDDSPCWVDYDTPDQSKRTLGCRRGADGILSDWQAIPPACRELLRRLLILDVSELVPERPLPVADTLLWGAGLCEMMPGDFLRTHLDADRHPLTGMQRRANAILFLTGDCGGALRLQDRIFRPAPGRLVLFSTTEDSWHGVMEPITAPRRSLAVYWWGLPKGKSRRPKAQFCTEKGVMT